MATKKASKISISIVLIVFLCAMVANIFLSNHIQVQKSHNEQIAVEQCFIDGGCATVQTSSYATTFGISNPIYGLVFFTMMSIFALYWIVQLFVPEARSTRIMGAMDYISKFGLILASLFSTWLLYAQFFLIKATCIYCLWVDGLTISMTIIYFVCIRKKLL